MPTVSKEGEIKYKGLSSAEAKEKLRTFGENTLAERRKFRPLLVFLEKFSSPLLLILIVAAGISFFVGERVNAFIIVFMVGVSAVLDFVNSYKSHKAMEALAARVVTTATVFRDGREAELPLTAIVPGDAVLLKAGDIIPADAEIVDAKDLFVNQAPLTGESFPVPKGRMKGDTGALFAASDRVFMGTNVVTGYATIKVLSTGRGTEFGKIAARLEAIPPLSDFEKGIRDFSVFIVRITFVLVTVVFLVNAFLGKGIFDSFVFAIAIAIGLTPELLPIIMTVSLSRGSVTMAKKEVVVKNLSAIESFGSMDVLCTDKTGTLTEDKIVLMKCVDGDGKDSPRVFSFAYISSEFHSGVRSPLDNAIKEHAHLEMKGYVKVDEVPFDFKRKRDSIVIEKDGERSLIAKGAPEDILDISIRYAGGGAAKILSAAKKKQFLAEFDRLSGEGFRVLAVAYKGVKTKKTYEKEDEKGMVFLGFAAFLDPPKPTAKQALTELEALGVEVKIVTGDSEILTARICRDIGVPIRAMYTGPVLREMDERAFSHAVAAGTIFARVTPEEKERIIVALKNLGRTVGYLGDGINDAPALKTADVGISVLNAVDVAKETADIIIFRKSLRVLKDGILEGRKTFQNTMKYIVMGLSSNFGNMVSMTAASAFLPFLPMLPTQILLNNFLYDSSQLTLATDAVDAEDTAKPPKWNMRFVKRYMVRFGLLSSIFDFATFGLLFLIFGFAETRFQTGWFIESLATQVFVIYVIRTKKMPFFESKPSLALFLNTLIAVTIAWLLPFSPLASLFSFAPLPPVLLLGILGIVLVYLLAAETLKRRFYRTASD